MSASPSTAIGCVNGSSSTSFSSCSSSRGGLSSRSQTPPVTETPPSEQQQIVDLQQRLVHLYHAIHCEDSNGVPPRPCRISRKCAELVKLLRHTNVCVDAHCEVPDCALTVSLVNHHKSCTDQACPICFSVNETKKRKQLRQEATFCIPRPSKGFNTAIDDTARWVRSAPPTPPPPPMPSPVVTPRCPDSPTLSPQIPDTSAELVDWFDDHEIDSILTTSQDDDVELGILLAETLSEPLFQPQTQSIPHMSSQISGRTTPNSHTSPSGSWQCYRCNTALFHGYRYHCQQCRVDVCAICMQSAQAYNQYPHEHYMMMLDY